ARELQDAVVTHSGRVADARQIEQESWDPSGLPGEARGSTLPLDHEEVLAPRGALSLDDRQLPKIGIRPAEQIDTAGPGCVTGADPEPAERPVIRGVEPEGAPERLAGPGCLHVDIHLQEPAPPRFERQSAHLLAVVVARAARRAHVAPVVRQADEVIRSATWTRLLSRRKCRR